MGRTYYVYILSNEWKNVLYIGVTNDLARRFHEHRVGMVAGFTKTYQVKHLVYYEETSDVVSAIAREKELKGWKRFKKNMLINSMNPTWKDLGIELGFTNETE